MDTLIPDEYGIVEIKVNIPSTSMLLRSILHQVQEQELVLLGLMK